MNAINITAYTDDASQIEAIKTLIKTLNIKYKISQVNEPEPPYNVEFVKQIKQGETDLNEGKGINISIDNLEDLCK